MKYLAVIFVLICAPLIASDEAPYDVRLDKGVNGQSFQNALAINEAYQDHRDSAAFKYLVPHLQQFYDTTPDSLRHYHQDLFDSLNLVLQRDPADLRLNTVVPAVTLLSTVQLRPYTASFNALLWLTTLDQAQLEKANKAIGVIFNEQHFDGPAQAFFETLCEFIREDHPLVDFMTENVWPHRSQNNLNALNNLFRDFRSTATMPVEAYNGIFSCPTRPYYIYAEACCIWQDAQKYSSLSTIDNSSTARILRNLVAIIDVLSESKHDLDSHYFKQETRTCCRLLAERPQCPSIDRLVDLYCSNIARFGISAIQFLTSYSYLVPPEDEQHLERLRLKAEVRATQILDRAIHEAIKLNRTANIEDVIATFFLHMMRFPSYPWEQITAPLNKAKEIGHHDLDVTLGIISLYPADKYAEVFEKIQDLCRQNRYAKTTKEFEHHHTGIRKLPHLTGLEEFSFSDVISTDELREKQRSNQNDKNYQHNLSLIRSLDCFEGQDLAQMQDLVLKSLQHSIPDSSKSFDPLAHRLRQAVSNNQLSEQQNPDLYAYLKDGFSIKQGD